MGLPAEQLIEKISTLFSEQLSAVEIRAQLRHEELLQEVQRLREVLDGRKDVPADLVSTLQMAKILDMKEENFKKWYERHPTLRALSSWHGRCRRWPAREVLAWFGRTV